MNDKIIAQIEKNIGYTFKDKTHIVRAFTHATYTKDATKNYQSLEFLGDSILDFVVAKLLMIENPDAHEGALTRRRTEIVSQPPLEAAMEKLGVAKYLVVGKGESVDSIISGTKVKSDIFEAIVAAIYFDSGSIDECERFIYAQLKPYFDGSAKHVNEKDSKTELNEFSSKHRLKVEYIHVEQGGKPHDPIFVVDVLIDGVVAGRGKGKSKKIAEQEAASIALRHIEGN